MSLPQVCGWKTESHRSEDAQLGSSAASVSSRDQRVVVGHWELRGLSWDPGAQSKVHSHSASENPLLTGGSSTKKTLHKHSLGAQGATGAILVSYPDFFVI